MDDDALDALADRLAEKVLARVESRLSVPDTPAGLEDSWPEWDELGGTDVAAPTAVTPASFPRPPRSVPKPAPAGVDEVLRTGDVVPLGAPDPHQGVSVGGHSTRTPNEVLAVWFEREIDLPRRYPTFAEDLT